MRLVKAALISLALTCFAIVTLRQRPQPYSKPDPTNKDCWPREGDKPYRAKNEAPQQRWHPEEKQHRRWEKGYWIASIWLTLAAGIGAGLSARFAYQAADQARVANQMNAESGRAWLGVKSLVIGEPLILGQPVSLFVSYNNFGREPAEETGFIMEYHSFPTAERDSKATLSIVQAFAARCASLNPQITAGISFPTNGPNSGYGFNLYTDDESTAPEDRIIVGDDLIRGNSIITMSGCLLYKTAGRVRHTSFCYHYQAGDVRTPGPRYCRAGNEAD